MPIIEPKYFTVAEAVKLKANIKIVLTLAGISEEIAEPCFECVPGSERHNMNIYFEIDHAYKILYATLVGITESSKAKLRIKEETPEKNFLYLDSNSGLVKDWLTGTRASLESTANKLTVAYINRGKKMIERTIRVYKELLNESKSLLGDATVDEDPTEVKKDDENPIIKLNRALDELTIVESRYKTTVSEPVDDHLLVSELLTLEQDLYNVVARCQKIQKEIQPVVEAARKSAAAVDGATEPPRGPGSRR